MSGTEGSPVRDVTLITGGARSGKSRRALELARRCERRAFVAPAVAFDDEMRERIARHRAERADFVTVEEPHDLARALSSLGDGVEVAVVDCLTVWLGNLVHLHGARREGYREADDFLAALGRPGCPVIAVTNELGMGVVPANAEARFFRDLMGAVNQSVARTASRVEFMVSGVPLAVKG